MLYIHHLIVSMNMKDRTKEFRSFVNVIEDARIDKLIQKKYPILQKIIY